jgi:putative ABC transport system permease protein
MADLHVGPIARSLVRHRAIFALVVLELASGFTIISCLILAASWYFETGHKSPGHEQSNLVAVRLVSPAPAGTPEAALREARARGAAERAQIAACTDVEAVTAVSGSAIDERWTFPVAFALQARPEPGSESFGMVTEVDPAAADVLGFQWLEGGPAKDGAPLPLDQQVVITRRLRQRLFGAGPALGRTIHADRLASAQVVGVIEDVMMTTPLLPHAESVAFHFGGPPDERERRYLVRARPGRRAAVVAALEGAFGSSRADRLVTVAPFDVRNSRGHQISSGLVLFLAIIGGVVGVIALLGAMSVASFLVVERRRQIGIRRALGATRADIVRYFLVESTLATAVGIGLGVLITSVLFIAMQKVFLELHFGWRTLLFSAALLWIDATLAAMIPALRGADVPPSVASRAL